MAYFPSQQFVLTVTGLLVTGAQGDFTTVFTPITGRHVLREAYWEMLSISGGITGTSGVTFDIRTNTGNLGSSYGSNSPYGAANSGQGGVTVTAITPTGFFTQSGITIRQITPSTTGILGVSLVGYFLP